MGYTSYLDKVPTTHPQARWDMFVEAVKHVASELPKDVVLKGWDGTGEPKFNENEIRFNGDGELSHETFSIDREGRGGFNFCKTAQKPYDLMVCATMNLYKHFFPEVEVSSDGDHEDWEPSIELVKEVTGLHLDWMKGIDEPVNEYA